MDVEEVIADILLRHCRIDAPPGQPDLRLAEDLGLDSVGLLTLALELENHYQMRLEEDPEEPPRTLGDLAALVRNRQ